MSEAAECMTRNLERKNQQRRWVFHALTQVLTHQRMLDEALDDVPPDCRAWVHEVTAGTLRWKGRIDWIIDQLALKKKPSGGIRKSLQVACYQLLQQPQVPQAWIVSETVDWVRSKEGEAAARFVNALLRRISDHVENWRTLDWPVSAPEDEQARWASLPEWLWRRLIRDHGREWSISFAESSLERPVFWFRSREPLVDAQRGPLSDAWKLESWRPIQGTDEYKNGRLFAQDISSQILIHEFTEAARQAFGTLESRMILDLCAAPGGKSAGLAWNGWTVLATDRQADTPHSQERFRMLEETAARINRGIFGGGGIQVVSRARVSELSSVDAVWVDAPCTGSGLLRRHPEVRWIKDERTLQSLQRDQATLLREAATRVRSGGLLMYTVCSVLRSDEVEAAIRSAGLQQFSRLKEWLFSPASGEKGDGFTGVLLQKV